MSTLRRAPLESTPLDSIGLGAGNEAYLESLYEQFLADPSSVDARWRDYFTSLAETSKSESADVSHSAVRDAVAKRAREIAPVVSAAVDATAQSASAKQGAVSRLIQVYANRG